MRHPPRAPSLNPRPIEQPSVFLDESGTTFPFAPFLPRSDPMPTAPTFARRILFRAHLWSRDSISSVSPESKPQHAFARHVLIDCSDRFGSRTVHAATTLADDHLDLAALIMGEERLTSVFTERDLPLRVVAAGTTLDITPMKSDLAVDSDTSILRSVSYGKLKLARCDFQ